MKIEHTSAETPTVLERVAMRVMGLGSVAEIVAVGQSMIDENAVEILAHLRAEHIIDHMRAVYDDTAAIYAASVQHVHVRPELIRFVNELSDGDLVLDLGCGPGRDLWFMAVPNDEYRESLTKAKENADGKMPSIALRVVGVDASSVMCEIARGPVNGGEVSARYQPLIAQRDMHDSEFGEFLRHAMFRGIWSNASFLTHTPESLVEPVFRSLVHALAPNGLLAMSYTQRTNPLAPYDSLKLSSVGRIKYFSHPYALDIGQLARLYGLVSEYHSAHDYIDSRSGQVKKDLFVTQFFRKVR